MNQDRTKRKLTAIMSADVVGYSRLMEADEAWTIKSLEENKKLMSSLIDEYKGRVVDAPGDNILAEFNSVINAVECTVKIQQELKKKNDNLIEARRMNFRIGINLGDVIEEGGRIFGNGVNIAARLEGLSDPGGICISGTAYDQIISKLDLGYEYLGEHNVKNLTIPVRVYRVLTDSKSAGKVIGEKRVTGRPVRLIVTSTIIAIIIAAGLTGWMLSSHQSPKLKPASIKPEPSSVIFDGKEAPTTIAVLPFENLSSEKDQEYFADGIAEELLNSLARLSELEVRGRTSSFYFKDKNEDIPTIAKMLNVDHIIEGSVRKAGKQVRITVQLIDTRKDAHIWSKTYERTMEDIFAIQDDIAKSVAGALQITLGVGELGSVPGMTRNPVAYDAYLAGSSPRFLVERDGLPKAIEQLEKAVALDPDFALCWFALSDLYDAEATWFPERVEESIAKGKVARSRVIELIPESDLALAISATQSNDIMEVERILKKALSLAPAYYDVNLQYGQVLSCIGRPEEAISYLQRAVRIEPLESFTYLLLALAYELSGDSDAAVTTIKKAKELSNQPEYYDISLLVLAPEENNRALIDQYGYRTQALYALLDTPEDVKTSLKSFLNENPRGNYNTTLGFAVWASYFGEHELALQAYRESTALFWGGASPIWRPIRKGMRKLPGFKDLVRELGLVDYWQKSGKWGDFCHPVGEDDFECE